MILSPEKLALIKADPVKQAMLERAPYAFYGWGLNYPKQSEVIRKWIETQPKITVLTGWRRTGKTMAAVYLKWPVPPMRERIAWIGGKSSDHIENTLVPLYKTILPAHMIARDITKNDKRIMGHNNTKFVLRTYEQELDMWKSGSADIVHLDEEPPIGVMGECLSRTATTNGKIFITVAIDDADVSWLPDACTNPKKYFGTDSFLHMKMGVEDVPEDIYPEVEKKAVYAKYDGTPLELAVRKGDFASLAGKWWLKFEPQFNVIEPFPIPDHWLKWRFIDAGVAAPSACAWVALHPSGAAFVYREYYKKGTTIDERCRDIIELSGNTRQRDGDIWIEHQKEKYIADYLDHAEFKADQVTGDSVDFLYVRSGICVQPWSSMGQEARRECVNRWLDRDMSKPHFITGEKGAPRLYVFNNCHNLIWEAQSKHVKMEKTDKHGVSERKIDNRADHLLDTCEAAVIELENWLGVKEEDFR